MEELLSIGNSLCRSFVGSIEFENGSKEGGNLDGVEDCCNLKAWEFETDLP